MSHPTVADYSIMLSNRKDFSKYLFNRLIEECVTDAGNMCHGYGYFPFYSNYSITNYSRNLSLGGLRTQIECERIALCVQ